MILLAFKSGTLATSKVPAVILLVFKSGILASAKVPEFIAEAGNPVTVPEFAKVTPEGILNVSPLSPTVKVVPLAGLILFL